MNDDQIIAIETTLSHHERQIQDLSEVLAAQGNEIERLKRQLEEAIRGASDTEKSLPTNAKPPHY